MTTEELIEQLKLYPGRTVVITWEGTANEIGPENIYLAHDGRLILDADDNFYRERIIRGD